MIFQEYPEKQMVSQDINHMASNIFLYVCYCLSSCATTIILILQDYHRPSQHQERLFYHPLMQTEMMVIGMAMCYLAYLLLRKKDQQEENTQNKPNAPVLVCCIPLMMDLVASSLELISLNYISGSVYSISNCMVIVSTAFFSRIILKTIFNRHQIFGCILTVLGVVIAGIGESLHDTQEEDENHFIFGVMMMMTAFVIEGVEMVVVEKVYAEYYITPIRFVGVSGIAGTVIWTAMLVIFTNVGCPFEEKHCVIDMQGNAHLQHVPTFFQDLDGDALLIILVIAKLFVVARYNYDTSTVVAKANAMVLVIITIFSNGLTWIVGIIITLIGRGNNEFQIERLQWDVNLMKLAGFIVTTLGLLSYNEVIKLSILEREAIASENLSSSLIYGQK